MFAPNLKIWLIVNHLKLSENVAVKSWQYVCHAVQFNLIQAFSLEKYTQTKMSHMKDTHEEIKNIK